ncbi:glycosyltransferase family 87 protein [Roseibium sp.]|uniref:glycosyltransferase family 87 protein n=1 Tax=Roseibium sp. TaxID=1936156 RepID=UPI003A980269
MLTGLRNDGWATPDRLVPAAFMALVAYLVLIVYLFVFPGVLAVGPEKVVINDFLSFWMAANNAVHGDPGLAYRTMEFADTQTEFVPNGFYAFFYPPTYLLLLLPFGVMTSVTAFLSFQAVGLAGIAWAGKKIAGHWHGALLCVALPTTFNGIFHGQNALWMAALLGSALYCLSERKEVWAGILIGLMTIKPQLGVLIPFALLAGGYWWTFISASVTVVALAAVSFLVFGADTWVAFWEQSTVARSVLTGGDVDLHKFVSVYGGLRLIGAGPTLAYGLQALVGAGMLVLVIHVWRQQVALEAKAIVLIGAGLLATPFILSYDLAVIAIALAFAVKLKGEGRLKPGAMSLGAASVAFACIARILSEVSSIPTGPLSGILLLWIGLCYVRPEPVPGERYKDRLPQSA